MADTNRAALLEPFHPNAYEYDPNRRLYIAGTVIEQRLDQATSGRWTISEARLVDRKSYATQRDGTEAVCEVVCELWLELPDLGQRPGCGQMTLWPKADYADAAKGATTAALRSAANRFGVGREIWPDLAAAHWLHWLGLLTTADQCAAAAWVLKALSRWLGSDDASREHKDAWRHCMEEVVETLEEAKARVGAAPARPRDADEPPADTDDRETRNAAADKSDQATMRRLSAMLTQIMKCREYAGVKALGERFDQDLRAALKDGRIRRGGDCAAQLQGRRELATEHARKLRDGAVSALYPQDQTPPPAAEPTAETQDASPDEIADGLIDAYNRASNPNELAQAQMAHEAARPHLAHRSFDVDDAEALACERIADEPVAAGAGR